MQDLQQPAILPSFKFIWDKEMPGRLNPTQRRLSVEVREFLVPREGELVSNWDLRVNGGLRDVIDLRPVNHEYLPSHRRREN